MLRAYFLPKQVNQIEKKKWALTMVSELGKELI